MPSLPEPPDEQVANREWIDEQAERVAVLARSNLRRIILRAYDAYVSTLTAAGDLAAFDSIPQEWGVFVGEQLLDEIDGVYRSGAVAAWNQAPTTAALGTQSALAWAAVVNEDAISYAAQASNRLAGVGTDVWLKVNSEVTEALRKGTGTEALKEEIERLTSFSEFRADTIARTEIGSAFVNGNYEAQKALGEYGPAFKEWLSVSDARTRPEHAALDGTVIPFDDMFDAGGEMMRAPHDETASAANVVNCRCDVLYYYPGDTLPDGTVVEAPGIEPDGEQATQEPEIAQLQSTEDMYLDRSSGTPEWLAERVESVHEPFIRELLSEGVRRDDPIVTFMGGGSGAGKGSLQKAGVIKPRPGTIVVDSDKAKLGIPEYQEMLKAQDTRAASVVHEESSFMAARAMAQSIESGFDTVLDGTGDSSIEKMTAKVIDARNRGGQRLVAEYVTIDTDEAIRRATARAERTGREVPRSIITGTHESVSTIFPQIVDRNLFDELRLWDNMGDSPELIFEMKDGVPTILNPERYEAFLRKSPAYPGYIPT